MGAGGSVAYIGSMHDVLPYIHLPEALEKGHDCQLQPLPRPLPVPAQPMQYFSLCHAEICTFTVEGLAEADAPLQHSTST